jgi:hypothetical protein
VLPSAAVGGHRTAAPTRIKDEGKNGRLIADVFCTNGELLDKAWVSVALVGTGVDHVSCKAIPLKVPEKNGCSGSADIGPLADAVKELGAYLGVVVLLTV